MTDPWLAHDATCWGCEAINRRKIALRGETGDVVHPHRPVWVTFEPYL